ncbi:MAG TPA: DUF3365 domain-containing protein [Opitutaceae bacterium]|nr:DUF3365 domain-containing protein [Opitutaceae bacterium]
MTVKSHNRIARPAAWSLVALLPAAALCTLGADADSAAKTRDAAAVAASTNAAISPQDQADALHFVIAADREMYVRAFAAAPAGARPGRIWPSPCELLRRACESIQSQGAEFSYALRSLHSLDPRNEPQTELEQKGLEFIASHPTGTFSGQEMLGGRRYFTVVYPDLPATASCVDCHNRRSAATPQRFKVGDVMGGIVVRVPLEF